jgi:hypothetical protein
MEEQEWQKAARESKERKALEDRLEKLYGCKLLNKRVRRKGRNSWEEGIVVYVTPQSERDEELYIQYDSDGTREGVFGLPFEIWNGTSWEKF